MTGEYRNTGARAVRLLRDHGLISQVVAARWLEAGPEIDGKHQDRIPTELKAHRTFQLFCRYIERADVTIAERKVRSLNLGSIAPINDALFANAGDGELLWTRQRSVPKRVRDLKKLFLETKSGKVSRSRAAQYRIPLRVLEEHFGADFPLSSIDREKCRDLVSFLPSIPSHVTQHYKTMTLKKAADAHAQRHGTVAQRFAEGQKHLRVLVSAFELALNEGWIERNPLKGLSIAEPATRKKFIQARDTYEPFTIEHLNKLFALPLFTGCVDDEAGCHRAGPHIIRRHRYWAPIIALWTGMRMNEILQLEKSDVQLSGNFPYIAVTDEEGVGFGKAEFRKRLKTKNSLRSIPVHPDLVRFGFLSWVECRSDGRLFPEAVPGSGEKPSDTYSKRVASNLKAAGIWKPRRLVFHSFRNTFNDALRAAGVELELREAINGWRAQNSMDQRYGIGHTLARLADAVSKISYDGLEVAHLREHPGA